MSHPRFDGKLYNWDSYFISLGLLVDGQVTMAKGMVDHFIFEIKHYGKVHSFQRLKQQELMNLSNHVRS